MATKLYNLKFKKKGKLIQKGGASDDSVVITHIQTELANDSKIKIYSNVLKGGFVALADSINKGDEKIMNAINPRKNGPESETPYNVGTHGMDTSKHTGFYIFAIGWLICCGMLLIILKI